MSDFKVGQLARRIEELKTLEELRKEFEVNFLILSKIKEHKLTFNKKLNCYTDLMGKCTHKANWVNGAWFMLQELNPD